MHTKNIKYRGSDRGGGDCCELARLVYSSAYITQGLVDAKQEFSCCTVALASHWWVLSKLSTVKPHPSLFLLLILRKFLTIFPRLVLILQSPCFWLLRNLGSDSELTDFSIAHPSVYSLHRMQDSSYSMARFLSWSLVHNPHMQHPDN